MTQVHPKKVLCLCECGKEKEFFMSNISPRKTGRYTVSCGCKMRQLVSEKNSTHGMSKTKFHKRWRSMFDRMSSKYKNAEAYKGISICKKWKKFENFRDDMYESYLEHCKKYSGREVTLDRKNVYGNYCKENCRWANIKEQSLNKKNTVIVEYEGKNITLLELCGNLGKDYQSVYHRLKNGRTLEQALFTPPWTRF